MDLNLNISFVTPLKILQVIPIDHPIIPEYKAVLAVKYNDEVYFEGENMSSQMKSGTYATLSVTWTDKGGNSVPVDGPTKWESSDSSIVTAEVASGNPLICNIKSVGPIGDVKISASADADLGQGVRTISTSYDIEVIAGDAVMGEIKFTQFPGQEVPKSSKGK
jgi:hypothetical protein